MTHPPHPEGPKVTIEHSMEQIREFHDGYELQHNYTLFGAGEPLTEVTVKGLSVDWAISKNLPSKLTHEQILEEFDRQEPYWQATIEYHKPTGPHTHRAVVQLHKKG